LETSLARRPNAPHPIIVLARPAGVTDDWMTTALAESAAAIPQATVVEDPRGADSRRFGVVTSGHVLLYDATGRLRYSGGLTPARGQQGESAGKNAFEALLAGDAADRDVHPVFGCPLLDSSERCPTKGAACRSR